MNFQHLKRSGPRLISVAAAFAQRNLGEVRTNMHALVGDFEADLSSHEAAVWKVEDPRMDPPEKFYQRVYCYVYKKDLERPSRRKVRYLFLVTVDGSTLTLSIHKENQTLRSLSARPGTASSEIRKFLSHFDAKGFGFKS